MRAGVKLRQLLCDADIITKRQLSKALQAQVKGNKGTIGEILVEMNFCDFEDITDCAIDNNTNNVNYETTTLILGQNLISEQSLSSPTSILDFGNLDLISAISDLNSGNWNFNDYSNNIDVDTAGSYAYFLDRSGGSNSLGYDYQEVAGIDAKNGLVMFNLQSRSAL